MKDQLWHYHTATFQDSRGALPSNALITESPELGCLIICKDPLYVCLCMKPLIIPQRKFSSYGPPPNL